MGLLESGTLYVPRFDPDGSGEWLELTHGKNGLQAGAGFPGQAEILIDSRSAADRAGATKMDRPEWIAVHPSTGEAYCSLTNNANRGKAGAPAPDRANPRADNVFGHIIRWRDRPPSQSGEPTAPSSAREPVRRQETGRRKQKFYVAVIVL